MIEKLARGGSKASATREEPLAGFLGQDHGRQFHEIRAHIYPFEFVWHVSTSLVS
jgi:hypothetical protein